MACTPYRNRAAKRQWMVLGLQQVVRRSMHLPCSERMRAMKPMEVRWGGTGHGAACCQVSGHPSLLPVGEGPAMDCESTSMHHL